MRVNVRYFILGAVLCVTSTAFAQDIFSPFYVVIGGFEKEENAQNFVNYAQEENLPAVYAFNEERKIFYVYVRATQTKEVATEILNAVRANSVFKDAWVFNGILSGGDFVAKRKPPIEKTPAPQAEPVQETSKPVTPEPVEKPSSVAETETPAPDAPKPVGKPFVFKLLNGESGNEVTGLVRLQEAERSLQFRGYNANEKVYVAPPANRSGKWFVVCQVVGFKQYKKPISYAEAAQTKGAAVGADDEVVIPIELSRVRKGDYIEMDGVKFFHNTALLTPGSERELDELLAMMQENPDYHIRLHGHTNGNESRDIISIGESKDFFTPAVTNAKTFGTAKQLSLLRAELVKAYLVEKGIDISRISVKGEGGKQMIFESSGTLAGMNDRVEVEITKH
jgi:outer membrane protein OmpA-like peptidoglycan-associated protein